MSLESVIGGLVRSSNIVNFGKALAIRHQLWARKSSCIWPAMASGAV